MTGRVYTIPQIDLVLPGPLPLVLRRSYSTFAIERDVGLGRGWTHSLSWEIEIRRSTLLLLRPDGTSSSYRIPAPGEEVNIGDGAWLRRDARTFIIIEAGLVYLFFAISSKRWCVGALVDLNGNRIELNYWKGVLSWIRDSVGRVVQVRRHQDGHIAALELDGGSGRRTRFKSYEYDQHGDLVAIVDAEGHAQRFSYEEHLLTHHEYASGLSVFYRYDNRRRCFETWCSHPGGVDPALAEDIPGYLADGITPAKGILHCKLEYANAFTQVVDSKQVRRYESNAIGKLDKGSNGSGVATLKYDEIGNISEFSDATGASTTYHRDASSRLAALVNPEGARTDFSYDARGNLTEVVNAMGDYVRHAYDDFSNLIETTDAMGSLLRYDYDSRGRRTRAIMPGGEVTSFRYDDRGNLVEVVEPHGKPRRIDYDELGRVTSFVNEEGARTSFDYDVGGRLRSVHLPNGGRPTVDYDPDGRIARLRIADGGVYELLWGGYNLVHELRHPDGHSVRFRYDRECNLVQIINERGEVHKIKRDTASRVVGEQTFDGRRYRYRLDEAGRLARIESSAGGSTELERDACGRVVARVYSDDTAERFEYDILGRLTRAENDLVHCEFTYDARGRLVRETQRFAGKAHEVTSEYTSTGKRTFRRTSLGHVTRTEYDKMSLPRRVFLDEEPPLMFAWNAADAEVERVLPGGGTVASRYDAVGFVAERRIVSSRRASPGEGHPEWVGELPPGTVYASGYSYSPGGELREESRHDKGLTEFRYDVIGRLVEKVRAHARTERYAYEAGGLVHEATPGAPRRTYGSGGRLVALNGTRYRYDGEARLIEKTNAADKNSRWLYEWNARGLLAAVVRPDGTRVENAYDPFARRVCKRVVAPSGAVTQTRFLWDGDTLVHEVLESEGKVCGVRTYIFRDDGPFPLAHRERSLSGDAWHDSGWVHYVNGPGEHSNLLVSGAGEILAELEPDLWGRSPPTSAARPSTPFRYPGQYFDEETGLAYNRHRFYDPETGRYISADPVGLCGGLEPFSYAYNRPLRVHDPLGLVPASSTVSGTAGSFDGTSGGPPGFLHPVVEAAFPPRAPEGEDGIYPRYEGGPPPGQSPTSCGEPRALSNYMKAWEEKNRDGRQMDPNNPADRQDIQKCLGSINSISSEQKTKGGDSKARAPCANCSQMLANLMDEYKQPDPSVIQPGATSKDGTDSTNFTKPNEDWASAQQAAVAAGGGQSGPQPPVVSDPVPPPTGPAYMPHSGYPQRDE